MNKRCGTALTVLTVLLVAGLVIYLIIEHGVKKWKCNEGHCEKVIGGDFSSLEKCRNRCSAQHFHDDTERRKIKKRRERIEKPHRPLPKNDKHVSFSPDVDFVFIEPRLNRGVQKVLPPGAGRAHLART
jgi:hypothetical protein